MKNIIFIKVKPAKQKDEILKDSYDITDSYRYIELSVKARPENGEANKSVILILSKYLNLSKNKIKILSGHSSSLKKIEINFD